MSTLEPVPALPPQPPGAASPNDDGRLLGESLAKGLGSFLLRNRGLLERLDELRTRLFRCLWAVGIALVAAWALYNPILHVLILPLRTLPGAGDVVAKGKLVYTSPTEAFFIHIKLVVFTAAAVASPVILWELWRFFTAGAGNKSRRANRVAVAVITSSILLFVVGAVVAFLFVRPALDIFLYLGGSHVVLVPNAADYLSFLVLLIVAFGLTFEYPLFLLALIGVGVINSSMLRKRRRLAYFILLVVAAVVTPTVDPITPLALALPLAGLYEATIVTARVLKR